MDLKTKYLGLDLPHPFMPAASPLVLELDMVRQLEDAGASAIVMNSLFEEQVASEEMASIHDVEAHQHASAEAASYAPSPDLFRVGTEEYLEQIRKIKETISIPVIGSLNGTTAGGWLDYGQLIVQAGADALELNVHEMVTDHEESGIGVESRILEVVKSLRSRIDVPIAVKLSPFYTSLPNFAYKLEEVGAAGFVLFNRFYQPDIDVEELETLRTLRLSDPSDLLLRLRWLAVLSGRVKGDLAVTGGVHSGLDALKAVMTGAHAVQVLSALYRHGPQHLATMRQELAEWLEEHDYESLAQARGSMNLERSPNPHAYERSNYIEILQTWQPT